MSPTVAAPITAALDYERTLVLAIEVSNKSWVLAAQVPGLPRTKAKRTINPEVEALLAAITGYRARAAAAGCTLRPEVGALRAAITGYRARPAGAGCRIERVVAVYEAGWSGFWLARCL